jgi:DNA-directed RNA polymerase specialized sigma24 family protein
MAIQRFKEFRSYDAFARWVYIRARWLALDELSRRRVFVEHPDSVDSVPASPVDPRIEEIRRIILYLPTQQQRVALDRLQGYTSEEISARMSIAPSTVRSIWRNAKQKIIEMMRDD